MRLGLTVGYSTGQMLPNTALIREAEGLGVDSIWTAEPCGSDAVPPQPGYTTQVSVPRRRDSFRIAFSPQGETSKIAPRST